MTREYTVLEQGTVVIPVQSEQDLRQYKFFVLGNSMKALVISDPGTTKAAASMDVRVGAMSDPVDIPGLAHFLEHMLFLGTQKYPEEDSYAKFIQSNGGSQNAATSAEATNYYFDVASTHLQGALDRFAQFFIGPLFTEDATEREMKAVDSEHSRNLQVDSRRYNAVLREACDPAHPMSKFSTGNLETLQTTGIREKLLGFYKEYYSSSVMNLVVYGREPIDVLESWVNEIFADVPNTHRSPPVFPPTPYPPNSLPVIYDVVPVKHTPQLFLLWPLDKCYKFDYTVKPEGYISHLLGHEGEGSVLSLLHKLGYAVELASGMYRHITSCSIFHCHITLTQEGVAHIDEIVSIIYQYLFLISQTLESASEWLWKETRALSEINFRFKQESHPINYVTALSDDLYWYKPEDVLKGDYMTSYNVSLVRHILNQLHPTNMILLKSSKDFEGKTSSEEKWLKVPYHKVNLDFVDKTLQKWQNAVGTLHPGLALPLPNEFIPEDFVLKYPHDPQADFMNISPEVIISREGLHAWFLGDIFFRQPRGHIFIHLISPLVYASPRNATLVHMFCELVHKQLNEVLYSASLAGLKLDISFSTRGVQIHFGGYHHKLPLLVHRVVEYISSFKTQSDHFKLIKEQITMELRNTKMEQPVAIAQEEALRVLRVTRWTAEDRLAVIESITEEDVDKFITEILSQVHLECFVHGNFVRCEAEAIINDVVGTWKPMPLVASQIPQVRVIQLDSCRDSVRSMLGPNPLNTNSAAFLYYQVGLDNAGNMEAGNPTSLRALLNLTVQLLLEPSFNQLRTKEQLGYVVQRGAYLLGGVYGLKMAIQSTVKDPIYLYERIENFLLEFRNKIVEMNSNDFASNVASLISKKTEKPHTLHSLSNRIWDQIVNHKARFDRDTKEVSSLQQLSKEHILEFYDKFILRKNKDSGKMVVQVFGKNHPQPIPNVLPDRVYIEDYTAFKNKMFVYPCDY